jgi:sugar O-acyltransferase (sialic acid O-acetyltransferase NeuD family)
MVKRKLIIFGLGDLARMANYYYTNDSEYEVTAFTVTNKYIKEKTYLELPVVPFETLEISHPRDQYDLFIAIGYSHLNQLRTQFYRAAKEKGYKLASYISSMATVLTDKIGDNTFIFEDNTIQPFVTIGNNVILWSGNHVGHDAIIGDNCFITSHVVIAGWTVVGSSSFIGINATIKDKVKIGERCVIGAGALITTDTQAGRIYKSESAKLSEIPIEKLKWI